MVFVASKEVQCPKGEDCVAGPLTRSRWVEILLSRGKVVGIRAGQITVN